MHIIIPARYASTRLPGKPLLDIAGQPMIARVLDCARASGAQRVVVATDDERIRDAVTACGGEVVMTRPDRATPVTRAICVVTSMPFCIGTRRGTTRITRTQWKMYMP